MCLNGFSISTKRLVGVVNSSVALLLVVLAYLVRVAGANVVPRAIGVVVAPLRLRISSSKVPLLVIVVISTLGGGS